MGYPCVPIFLMALYETQIPLDTAIGDLFLFEV